VSATAIFVIGKEEVFEAKIQNGMWIWKKVTARKIKEFLKYFAI
jgi:hypothetical protein